MDLTEFSRLKDKNNYKRHPWEIARKKVLYKLIDSFKKEQKLKSIVDIGSGDGYIINQLAINNFAEQYFAIDISYTKTIIEQIKLNNKNQEIVYYQNINEYLKDHIDDENVLFLCMDVLEHLENENEILNYLDFKKNNNYYLFTVPAFQYVFSNHDSLLGHYRRYNLRKIKDLLKQFGFSIQKSGYFFSTLLIIRFIEKIINSNKNKSIENWDKTALKTNLIILILLLDFKISNQFKKIGINFLGLSCYCICKKQ